MRSSQKATIIFVAILLLFLLPFVSAELNKRDPQAPGDAPPAGKGGDAPAEPPAGGKAPAAGGDAPPAGGKAGDAPAEPPPAGGKAPPAGGDAPPAGGNPPGGNPPGGNPPGGNPPGGNPPGGNPPGGNPPGGNPPGGNPPGGNPAGGNPQTGAPDNSTTPKYISPQTPTVQVVMIDPKTSKNLLYRIGSNITFKWEYSDVFQDPPKYIMVAAQPQVNVKTNYTIAQNLTVNNTQEVTWVTSTVPSLPMSQYKLIICDQDGTNAPPKPGGLQSFSTLTFGLYSPQDPGTVIVSNAISTIIPSLSNIGLALITIISFSFISI